MINAPWVTPGSWTQIPTLDCLLTQCYSIKSWLDIRSDHIAIVHCANGRSRSGILVACLMKYMGAFDNASDAFEFFCSARYVLRRMRTSCHIRAMTSVNKLNCILLLCCPIKSEKVVFVVE